LKNVGHEWQGKAAEALQKREFVKDSGRDEKCPGFSLAISMPLFGSPFFSFFYDRN